MFTSIESHQSVSRISSMQCIYQGLTSLNWYCSILLDLISDLRSEAPVFVNNEDSEIQQIEFKSRMKYPCFLLFCWWIFLIYVLSASHPCPNSFHFDHHNIREEVKIFKMSTHFPFKRKYSICAQQPNNFSHSTLRHSLEVVPCRPSCCFLLHLKNWPLGKLVLFWSVL